MCHALKSGDQEYSKKIDNLKNYFLELDRSKFFEKLPTPQDEIQVAYEIGKFLPSLLFTYSLIKNEFSKDEVKSMESMFKNIVKRYQYVWSPSLSENSRNDNKGLFFNNYTMLTSIILNDEKMFNSSIKKFRSIMNTNSSNSGFLKIDGRRGECALNYNYHGLVPLLSSLWTLKLQGYDFVESKITRNHTLDEIVNSILISTLEPKRIQEFQKEYGTRQIAAQTSCYSSMNEERKIKYYDVTNDVVMPSNPSQWIFLYKKLSNNYEKNVDLFYNSLFLKENLEMDDEHNNAIGVFSSIIYQNLDEIQKIESDNQAKPENFFDRGEILNYAFIDYDDLKSQYNFRNGEYLIRWFWKVVENKIIIQDEFLVEDKIKIDGNSIEFINIKENKDISKKNRSNVRFYSNEGMFSIFGELDLASDDTYPTEIVGSNELNNNIYEAEGVWGIDGKKIEYIKINLLPITNN